ncbi:DNA-directed RNA polymerase subunit omega [Metallumcola ferriviriculae]|uniref:DNA-directed RNA polymerase subunit omega n=1 Tax=Metallumcola ferriviriculae TaxID=3039180 RepID=A0AAU0UP41_9FIRM|nr:DNA-directed RNA polymerase subunit omega [Desulfitibacteraceae bacterium MK1]
MNQPPIDILLKRVDSKYALVVMAAKRARILTDENLLEQEKTVKPVTRALHEIGEGKFTYVRTKDGIK